MQRGIAEGRGRGRSAHLCVGARHADRCYERCVRWVSQDVGTLVPQLHQLFQDGCVFSNAPSIEGLHHTMPGTRNQAKVKHIAKQKASIRSKKKATISANIRSLA